MVLHEVAADPYDAVAYEGHAYPQTHPDRLATQAVLFGLRPTPPARCRVLELGCGEGENLIPMALGLPRAEFVGVDLAAAPIARGSALARALGVGNVRLMQGDLASLPDDIGAFDYVVAHGVYSWIPPAARDALLAACGRLLTQHGVAYVSYNAYPAPTCAMRRATYCAFTSRGSPLPSSGWSRRPR